MPVSLVSPAAWAVFGLVVAVDLVLCLWLGLSVRVASLTTPLLVGALAAGIAWFYTVKRQEPALAAMAASVAFLIVFTPFGAILSYATTALDLPMHDAVYAAADVRLGLDWMAMLEAIAATPAVVMPMRIVYSSSLPHVAIAVAALAVTGQHERLRTFIFLFAATASITCVLSGLLPAIGTFAYYAPSEELRAVLGMKVGVWHVAPFNALRDGSLTVIDLVDVQGLVTFPSFHAALAIVCGWATWSVRWVAWPSAVLAVLIVAATPHIGGHYFVDLIGGGVIAWAAIWLATRPKLLAAQQPAMA